MFYSIRRYFLFDGVLCLRILRQKKREGEESENWKLLIYARGLYPLQTTLANPRPGPAGSKNPLNLLCFKRIARLWTIE